MLHVAFDELVSGGPEQVLARQVRPRERQRHHVLQLVAEAECAARLVVARPGPEAAAQVLIHQPSVHQQIKGIVGRPDPDHIERAIPGRLDLLERGEGGIDASMTCHELLDVVPVIPFPQQEDDAAAFPGLQHQPDVKRRARVEGRAELAGERQLVHRRGP